MAARLVIGLMAWLGYCASAVSDDGVSASESTKVVFDGPFVNVVLEDQKVGEHRVWVNDFAGGVYSRAILFNADNGEMLGSVETGWEGVKLDIPKMGEEFYTSALYMSRGYHGERTDVLEFFNRSTLNIESELVLPPKAGRGIPNANHSNFSDDEAFLFLTFFTPASSVGVVDLKAKKYIGEIETAGCAYVFSGGPRRFFALCGDGSVLAITIDNAGKELSRKRYQGLFDPIGDPLHGTAVRSGETWYFVTYLGQVHTVDVSGEELVHKVLWSAGEKSGANKAWVPAEMYQNLAIHDTNQRLYVLTGEQDLTPKGGGADYHRKNGTEVWVFDLASGERIQRLEMPQPMTAISVSQDKTPVLYAANVFSPKVLVLDAVSGEQLRELDAGFMGFPTVLQPIEPR